ncbi:AraC family transcriptional regulator [Micromonospora sp. NPDC049230]|uniref:helix-turn-helix transcriptional regulator n=1 Tax=Micromonospora sp. NPDC049230 TaxID=3155502 RepID=UPI0033F8AF23
MPHDAVAAGPPIWRRYETREVSGAHDVISQECVGIELRSHDVTGQFTYQQESVQAGPVLVSRLRCGADIEGHFLEPLTDLIFLSVLHGQVETRDGRDETRTGPGEVLLNPTGRPFTNICRDFDIHGVTLDPRTVAEAATERTGIAPVDFRFEAITPISREMGQFWHSTTTHLYDLFNGPSEPLRSPLVVGAAIDQVTSAALAVFPNSAMTAPHRIEAVPSPAGPVRRAVSFIETHADEPITVTQIADAARVTPRALQAAFRRQLGTTPMAYLRRTRLDRAHRDLLKADPTQGGTVDAVAHRWGYPHLGRLAADYRAVHGQSPTDTLHT